MKLVTMFLLSNCFNFGNFSFQPITGISWTLNQHIFPYDYENKWLLDNKKRDLQKASLFSDLSRFIDNLCATDDHLEFDKNQ